MNCSVKFFDPTRTVCADAVAVSPPLSVATMANASVALTTKRPCMDLPLPAPDRRGYSPTVWKSSFPGEAFRQGRCFTRRRNEFRFGTDASAFLPRNNAVELARCPLLAALDFGRKEILFRRKWTDPTVGVRAGRIVGEVEVEDDAAVLCVAEVCAFDRVEQIAATG